MFINFVLVFTVLILQQPELIMYDKDNVWHTRSAFWTGAANPVFVMMLIAISWNLRNKSPPLIFKINANEVSVRRFSVAHPRGYTTGEWSAAIAKQMKAIGETETAETKRKTAAAERHSVNSVAAKV